MAINSGQYCEVNIPTADIVLSGPTLLPNSYVDYQSNSWKNLKEDTVWPDSRLLTIGWYPYVEVDTPPLQYPEYYDRTLSAFNIQATEVTRTAQYIQWTIEELKNVKNLELESQITQYTTNQLSVNPKVQEYITNEAKWLADQQAAIARLDVWDDVAAFDTTKPSILVLPNNFIAEGYIRQGQTLTSENQSASGSGLAEPWDQTAVNAFISNNQPAANDVTGSTSPVEPTFELRQGIATINEQFNRIVIYRFDREDPIPSQRRAWAMDMFNRQDNRDLFVFSYLAATDTYLDWDLFQDKGNGQWGFVVDNALYQYTDNDLYFIFSYSNVPSVQQDWFTDKVYFDAGQEEINFLVAWDPV